MTSSFRMMMLLLPFLLSGSSALSFSHRNQIPSHHSSHVQSQFSPPSSSRRRAAAMEDNNDNDDNLAERIMETSSSTTIPAQDDSVSNVDDDEMDWLRFAGIDELYHSAENIFSNSSTSPLEIFQSSTVAIVGLGGIGSWAAEALVRTGVSNFVLIDLADLCVSQTTSGLNSMKKNIGKFKTQLTKERILEIHPLAQVTIVDDFVMMDNVQTMVEEQLMGNSVDVAIDCIDGQDEMIAFWKACQANGIATITTGSPNGKIDPTKVVCRTLDETVADQDESLRECWEQLRVTEEGRHLARHVHCVFSEETSVKTPIGQDCQTVISFVSGSFGFVAASNAINVILSKASS